MANLTRREFLGLGIGGAAGGLVGYNLGSPLNGFFSTAETASRDFRVIYKFDRNDDVHLEKILEDLPESERQVYEENNNRRMTIYQKAGDYIEALQRPALKTPGAESAPVKEVRGIKRRLFEFTKGFLGEESKKEAEIQSNPRYTGNYNDLAILRLSLMEGIGGLESSMNGTAYKIRANEHNTHSRDNGGRELLDRLLSKHSARFDLLRKFQDLTPQQVLEGNDNRDYLEVIDLAEEYEIKPYEPKGLFSKYSSYGTALVGGIIGAWAGNFVTGKGAYAINTVLGTLRDLGGIIFKPIKQFRNRKK